MTVKRATKKAFIPKEYCVACGVCASLCPKKAITIHKGMFAKVSMDDCVGCGKCVKQCPASIIEIKEALI